MFTNFNIYNMENIYEYITQSYEYRTAHINLNEECVEVGGNSTTFKGLLSYEIRVTIPSGYHILLCHKCNNGNCSNTKHLYYGTPKENHKDAVDAGTWKNPWERMVERHGIVKAKEIQASGNKSAGGMANAGIEKSSEHKAKISKALCKEYCINDKIYHSYNEIKEDYTFSSSKICRLLKCNDDWNYV